ncbi:hypothetical protein DYB37_013588 [Aphanomyces astaci]|uniref:Uncharacterized protein n=1 Tax=Aphanomyces astaci TaxID=112090 RepID=A0A3R7DYP1_APHAT|nr:hypothetical protein DYB35_011421 [Aphanomyces astaci]RHZ29141.1 hypothetical protein DYB37_013588 [Aphanomyces astaci]
MSKFVRGESASLRKSGTPEEYEESEQLLGDIQARMEDFKTHDAVPKNAAKRNLEGIENADALLRKMAMAELDRGSNNEEQDSASPSRKM